MKVTVYIATSLDGYIARQDGDLDWLDKAQTWVPEGEDLGYMELMSTVDVLVMGRNTYEKVRSFGEWPYRNIRVIVLSRANIEFPEDLSDKVSCSSESPDALCERLSSEGVKHIYVDGGAVIQSFLRSGLVTEMTITTIPMLIGGGISLFGDLDEDILLEHIETKAFEFGFVQSKFGIAAV